VNSSALTADPTVSRAQYLDQPTTAGVAKLTQPKIPSMDGISPTVALVNPLHTTDPVSAHSIQIARENTAQPIAKPKSPSWWRNPASLISGGLVGLLLAALGIWAMSRVGNADSQGESATNVNPASQPPLALANQPAGWALAFEDKGAVRIPTLARSEETPVTLECWCQITPVPDKYCAIMALGGKEWVGISYGPNGRCNPASERVPKTAPGSGPLLAGTWSHLAAVFEGRACRLYVNGTLQVRVPLLDTPIPTPRPPGDELILGATKYGRYVGSSMNGQLREVRVTGRARYSANFTPPKRFTADQDTLALYLFDEGTGDQLLDSSGHDHHGKIFDAKWVSVTAP
jgi:hypothetical protein